MNIGLLNKGDKIPQANAEQYWPWDPKAFYKYYDSSPGRVGMVNAGTGKPEPTMSVLTRWDPSRETPTLSAYLERTKNKVDSINNTLNPRSRNPLSPTYIPREVFAQVEKELSDRNIDTLLTNLGDRVQHFMQLSPEAEATRIRKEWDAKVLPGLQEKKSEWTKRRIDLEMKMADALGSRFMSGASASSAKDAADYADKYLSSQFSLYGEALAKHMQGMVGDMQSSFEQLLPSAPKDDIPDPNAKLEFISDSGSLVSASVNMETGAWSYNDPKNPRQVVGTFANVNSPDSTLPIDVNSRRLRIAYNSAKTAWDNRRNEMEQDNQVKRDAYENLRTYLRSTVGSTLIGYMS